MKVLHWGLMEEIFSLTRKDEDSTGETIPYREEKVPVLVIDDPEEPGIQSPNVHKYFIERVQLVRMEKRTEDDPEELGHDLCCLCKPANNKSLR